MTGRTPTRCRIVKKLGDGGMGVVCNAGNTELGRLVAFRLPATGIAHRAQEPERSRRLGQAASAVAKCVWILLLCVPAVAENDLTLVLGWPFVGNSVGNSTEGGSPSYEQQSAKTGFSIGLEYRHRFANRVGIQFDYNRTSTNATFRCLSSDSWLSYRVTRHEIGGAFVRYFNRSESKLHPFFHVGPGVLLFDGGYATGGTVGWSATPEVVLGGGFDTAVSKHLSVRTAYRLHLFRNSDFGDAQFHPGFTHLQQPMVGLSWQF